MRNNQILDFDEPVKSVDVALKHVSQISNSSMIEILLPISPVLKSASRDKRGRSPKHQGVTWLVAASYDVIWA